MWKYHATLTVCNTYLRFFEIREKKVLGEKKPRISKSANKED